MRIPQTQAARAKVQSLVSEDYLLMALAVEGMYDRERNWSDNLKKGIEGRRLLNDTDSMKPEPGVPPARAGAEIA